MFQFEGLTRSIRRRLDLVYDGDIDGYVTTINLAEFRYIAARITSTARADAHIDELREAGLNIYPIDGLWAAASDLKAAYSPALADAYAVAAAQELDEDVTRHVTLLVGTDDDYDVFEDVEDFAYLIERFRDESTGPGY